MKHISYLKNKWFKLTGNKVAESYGGHGYKTEVKTITECPIFFPKHEETSSCCQIQEEETNSCQSV